MIGLWRLIQNSGDYLLFGAILIVVIILFVREFDLTKPRAWLILFGLSALGIVMLVRTYRKSKLLAELAEREKALEELEKSYKRLKDEQKISEEHYEKAREELEAAKKRTARDILETDESYREELKKIDEEYREMTPAEMISRSRELLNS